MSRQSLKKQLYSQIARIGKAACHGHRLELLEYLAQGERTVDALAKLTGLSVANASQHLRVMRHSGLVTARKEGLYVYYRLADDEVIRLLISMRKLAESQLAEVEQLVRSYLTVKDDLEAVPRSELLERVRNGLAIVVDVRPPEEYAAGHVPGAVNIPLKDLEQRLKELPREQEIVAYCRGPHCVLAFDAVAQLRAQGFHARRLEDGFPEWREAGLPVEKTAADVSATRE
ncbi:MAG TPA: metalloregulator ArsR/SmtB family transcription factor [Candidatus Methylomirabilis sp.]|nr:metalloregulator ArsR/SmtB family transcription factor [Candidatus Methylomirabilis sp.]